MPTITLFTRIKAPLEQVFDLSRSLDFHLDRLSDPGEKISAGQSTGLLELDSTVTWVGSPFKFRQELQTKVTALQDGSHWTEERISGPFSQMKQTHSFSSEKAATVITNKFSYKTSRGPIAWFVENAFLTALLRRHLADRNRILKEVAESEDWQRYLPDTGSQRQAQ